MYGKHFAILLLLAFKWFVLTELELVFAVYFYNGLLGEGVEDRIVSAFFPLSSSFTLGPPLPPRRPWILGLLCSRRWGWRWGGLYTVTATDPPGAAPEPASVTLLEMGLLTGIGPAKPSKVAGRSKAADDSS
jgi:hypothetical protein